MNILIVDDDAVSRRLLRGYLEKWGYEVTQASNGAEGWALIEQQAFPLVVVDWMMPELDGLELVRRIRQLDRPGYVYTILLTARAQKEDLVQGMEAGADDFLSKPFDRDELRARLREGERILGLEQAAAKHELAWREASAAAQENEPWVQLGRRAPRVTAEIQQLADAAMRELTGWQAEPTTPVADTIERARQLLQQLRAATSALERP